MKKMAPRWGKRRAKCVALTTTTGTIKHTLTFSFWITYTE